MEDIRFELINEFQSTPESQKAHEINMVPVWTRAARIAGVEGRSSFFGTASEKLDLEKAVNKRVRFSKYTAGTLARHGIEMEARVVEEAVQEFGLPFPEGYEHQDVGLIPCMPDTPC